jgi:hypothetical protein
MVCLKLAKWLVKKDLPNSRKTTAACDDHLASIIKREIGAMGATMKVDSAYVEEPCSYNGIGSNGSTVWELIGDNLFKYELSNGTIYRYSNSMVFVPLFDREKHGY